MSLPTEPRTPSKENQGWSLPRLLLTTCGLGKAILFQVTDSCVLMATTWGCFEDKCVELGVCIMQIQRVVSVPQPHRQTSSSSAWQPFKYSREVDLTLHIPS